MNQINKNKRKIGLVTYWATDNPNIVIKMQTVSAEIYLDKLDAQINALEEELASNQSVELPQELLDKLNQTMSKSLNDDGQMFEEISEIVKQHTSTADQEALEVKLRELTNLKMTIVESY